MLRRALESLQAQTYPHWKAIVYDDSTNAESQAVVEACNDERIAYQRNPQRLGAIRNIDQCFSPLRLLGGEFGCLLEDDNFWLVSFLSSVVRHLERRSWDIIQMNQMLTDDGSGNRTGAQTTRGGWFSAGPVEPIVLRAALLLMEGVSNGGLVWRLDNSTDLRHGDAVCELALTEYCRSLVIRAPFLFSEEPLAACTVAGKTVSARATDRNRAVNRGMQSLRDYVLKMHGDSILGIARKLAEQNGLLDRLAQALSYGGHPLLARSVAPGQERRIGRAVAKGLAVRLTEKDPCAAFLASGRVATIATGAAN